MSEGEKQELHSSERRLYQLMSKAYDAGDYESAYNTFTKALEVERTRAYLVNRGDSLREQGLLVSHHLTSHLLLGRHSCRSSPSQPELLCDRISASRITPRRSRPSR